MVNFAREVARLNCLSPKRLFAMKISAAVSLFILFSIITYASTSRTAQNANINSQSTDPAPGQISGHIRRADTGAPIAKAEVSLLPSKPNPDVTQDSRLFAITDAEGAFTIGNIRPGSYAAIAERTGFVSRGYYSDQSVDAPETINVVAGQVLEKVDIRLVPAGVISGTVADEDNEPIAGVTVEAVSVFYMPGGSQREARGLRVFTDDMGNFRLYGLPQGNYLVRIEVTNVSAKTGTLASRVAYYPGTPEVENAQQLRVTPGNELSGIHFSVGPLAVYSVTGNVVDASGFAGQGRYQLTAMNAVDAANDGGRITRAISGTGGSFTLNGLPAGTYSVYAIQIEPESTRVSARGGSGSAIVRVSDTDVRANVQVSADAEVSGRIAFENSSGKSLGGFTVRLWPRNSIAPIRSFPNAVTDRNGAFKITYVPSGNFDFVMDPDAGTYLKQAVCNGKDYTLTQLSIEGGVNINDCALTLGADTGVIKGQVLDGDKPAPRLVVVAIPEEISKRHLGRFTFTGISNGRGEYQLSGVIPGDYLVFAVPKDDEQSYFQIDFADRNQRDAERVSVKSGDAKTVTLKPATAQE
jgi:Carboxypeptidase regulatory-like domain